MNKKDEKYLKDFMMRLDKFMKGEKNIADSAKINEDVQNAIHTRAFNLLGQNAKYFEEKAKIK